MQKNKLISIVLATYNGEEYFREALDSIMAQTYTNFELIIIDDGSTDSTGNIALEYVKKDSRVQYYKNEVNLKQAASLNRGFALSKGEYLTWTSDDNNLLPNCLEKLAEYLDSHEDCGLCFGRFDIVLKGQVVYQPFFEYKEGILKNGNFHSIIQSIGGSSFLYRRKIYETIGDYTIDENQYLVLDNDYWIRIALKYNISPINFDECIYYHRAHDLAMSTKYQSQVQYQNIFIIHKYYKNFSINLEKFYALQNRLVVIMNAIDKDSVYYEKSLKIINQIEKEFEEEIVMNIKDGILLYNQYKNLQNELESIKNILKLKTSDDFINNGSLLQKNSNSTLEDKWYKFGQLTRRQKIKAIGLVLSKKLKIYGLLKPIYTMIKPIFKIFIR